VDVPAILASSGFLIGVKRLVERGKIPNDALETWLNAMHADFARKTIPIKRIDLVRLTLRLDDKSNRTFLRTLRRMSNMRGQMKDIALAIDEGANSRRGRGGIAMTNRNAIHVNLVAQEREAQATI
jgi:hypothetical protein